METITIVEVKICDDCLKRKEVSASIKRNALKVAIFTFVFSIGVIYGNEAELQKQHERVLYEWNKIHLDKLDGERR